MIEIILSKHFFKEQAKLLKPYILDIAEVANKLYARGYDYQTKIFAGIYYIIKEKNLPITVRSISKVVKIQKIRRILEKSGIKLSQVDRYEKVGKYIEFILNALNIDVNKEAIIERCISDLKKVENKVNDDLAFVCAWLFYNGFVREIDLARLTGVSEVTIRNYRKFVKISNE